MRHGNDTAGNSLTDFDPSENSKRWETARIRLPCVLLIDTSDAMKGIRINDVNAGLGLLRESLDDNPSTRRSIEIAIVTFGGTVDIVQDFVPIEHFIAPHLDASGNRPMAAAIEVALDLIDMQRRLLAATSIDFCTTEIILLTSGKPTDSGRKILALLKNVESNYFFRAASLDDEVMDTLKELSDPEFPPKRIVDSAIKEYFRQVVKSLEFRPITRSIAEGIVDLLKKKERRRIN